MAKYLIGIDPGKKGGVAVYSFEEKKIIDVCVMPDTPFEMNQFIKKYSNDSVCYLEKVGAMPGQGVSSMFTFGKGVGWLEMSLIANGIPFYEVTPQKWQKFYQLGGRQSCSDKNAWKVKLKDHAQKLFPKVWEDFNIKTKEKSMSIADALLILEYGRNDYKE